MKQVRKIAKRLGAVLLGTALVLTMFQGLVGVSGEADAAASLPEIELIREQGGVFRILEIVPDAAMGGVGYLAQRQEPFSGWEQTAMAMKDAKERQKYAGDIFDNLIDAGLLSGGGETALTIDGGRARYTEAYPWQEHAELQKANLEAATTVSDVKGIFSLVADGTGDYIYTGGYEVVSSQKGDVNQIVDHFEHDPAGSDEAYFWYEPTFARFSVSLGLPDSTSVYVNTGDGNNAVYTYKFKAAEITDGSEYYYVSNPGTPKKNETGSGKRYAAISSGFIAAPEGDGWFKRSGNSYTYVGEGGGDYNYSPAGRDSYTVTTYTIFYTGIKNNNWLLKNTFDWEPGEAAPEVGVLTASASSLTLSDINSASLIVLSKGYYVSGAVGAYETGDYSKAEAGSTDLSADMAAALKAAAAKKPIVLDKTLISGDGLEVNKLASELSGGSAAGVYGRLYVAELPLPSDFTKALQSGFGNYSLIETQINNNSGKLLNTTVNPAAALRYIIAFAKNTNVKGSIRVLEIQPGKTGEISPEDVQQWIGLGENNEETQIEINTVSAAELVGMTESIAEQYDMVYIGSKVSDFKTTEQNGEQIRVYNDYNMDGLVYTNIGDTVVSGGDSGFNLSGLLDRDYDPAKTFSANGKTYNALDTGYRFFMDALGWFEKYNNTTRTFRYSGNDITQAKRLELKAFADAGYPIVVANDLLGEIKLTDSDFPEPVGSCDYSKVGVANWWSCEYGVEVRLDTSEMTLSAYLAPKEHFWDSNIKKVKLEWYKRNADGTDKRIGEAKEIYVSKYSTVLAVLDLTQTDISDGTYYCKLTALAVGSDKQITNVKPAYSDFIEASTNKLNANRVDNSSLMYALLNDIKDKKNVMPRWQTRATESQNTLKLYTNLVKPKIDFTTTGGVQNRPPEYKMTESGVSGSLEAKVDGSYSLDFSFILTGSTAAQYTCKLYVDGNGDGRFLEDEELTGAVIKTSQRKTVTANTALTANMTYDLSCTLPPDALGIIPWKLVIQNNARSYLSCTAEGFAHIAPAATQIETLNILQLNSSTGGLSLETNTTFQNLFTQVESEFKVNLMTIRADELDTLLKNYQKYLTDRAKPAEGGDSEALIAYLRAQADAGVSHAELSLSEFLQSFDMLIMGFSDKYEGISKPSAQAIVEFIKTGKATLFSHDCTSFYFLPTEGYQTSNWSGNSILDGYLPNYVYSSDQVVPTFTMFGYDFNMTIRDAVGLDRYGVTSKEYGLTQYSGAADASGVVASDSYLSMTAEQKNALLNAGYSIAYEPKSGGTATVSETQGLTAGLLTRFFQSGGRPTAYSYNSGTESSTQITQVNKGQITTYPFDMNTAEFGGSNGENGRIAISQTHEQYDQLNLNSDDVVVWYCLAGGEFDHMPNDAVNSYYIYNRKNVTYTGFGHTTSSVNLNEAKLLVNTIVAAYRSGEAKIRFTDSTGTKNMTSFLLPSDGETLITAKNSNDPARRIYFKVDGKSGGGEIGVSFALGGQEIKPKLYKSSDNSACEACSAGELYYIKLDELLQTINNNIEANGLSLTASLSIDKTTADSASLTLRRLSLFDLS